MSTPATLEDEMRALTEEIQASEKNIKNLSGRQFNGTREEAIIFCLKRAYDLAQGASMATMIGLPETVNILMRGLFEIFIQTYWITLSDENAQKFALATDNEMRRQLRAFLKKDLGTVSNKETGENKNKEVLNEWASLPQNLSFQTMATEAGIGNLCQMMYGGMSRQAHGYSFGLSEPPTPREQLDISISASVSWMQAINSIAVNWITGRTQISSSEMYSLLDMSRFNV